jgi:hypothetical protein
MGQVEEQAGPAGEEDATETREVWRELDALGASVRDDAHAADALAVAYETMHRVEANVRTLVDRLAAVGYAFGSDGSPSGVPPLSGVFGALMNAFVRSASPKGGRASAAPPHVPPGPNAPRELASFEKRFGTLPLSLRAFYETVGQVDLTGRHPTLRTSRAGTRTRWSFQTRERTGCSWASAIDCRSSTTSG